VTKDKDRPSAGYGTFTALPGPNTNLVPKLVQLYLLVLLFGLIVHIPELGSLICCVYV